MIRGFIVDCYGEEGRGDQIRAALQGYELAACPQLSDAEEEDWEFVADDIRALLDGYEFVLLHVNQNFALNLLEEICGSRPVFCYKGGPARPAIEAHCETPGFHVLSPGQFSRSNAGDLPKLILRWLKALGPIPSQETARTAWHEVRSIDPKKEKKIQDLDARLVGLLRKHNWMPECPISNDLTDALKSLRDESGGVM